ncbi:MAG TPA: PAS domain S-box protein, partial [Gemmatimonadales bacterium]
MPRASILVVEDNAITRKMVRVALEEAGFQVTLAPDGAAALEAVSKLVPDLILQDLVLPDFSGFDLVELLRAAPGCEKTIILAFTGFVSDAEDQRIGAASFDGLLIKPVAPSRLIATIEEYLAKPSSPASRHAADATPLQLKTPVSGLDPGHRAELQASALGVLGAIADALSRRKDVETALDEVLAQSIDAAGLSRGAILLFESGDQLRCLSQIGFDDNLSLLSSVFAPDLLAELRAQGAVLVLTPEAAASDARRDLLVRTGASSALVAPIRSGPAEIGLLLLTSATKLLTGDEWRGFARAIAAQLGQAIALRHTFDRLADSEAKYRGLFDGVPVGLIRTTTTGEILEANRTLVQLLGCQDGSELIGSNTAAYWDNAADREPMLTQISAKGFVNSWPARMRRRNGAVIEVEISATAVASADGKVQYLEGSITDVTHRRRAETELIESEARFRQLAENVKEMFFITDIATGQSIYVSPAYETIWGRSCASAYARPFAWADGVHPDDLSIMQGHFRGGLPANGVTHDFRVTRPNGELRWVRAHVFSVRNAQGDPYRLVGTGEDITERRQTEQQLVQAQKMEAVGQLAGGIAHDFNNLLAAITVFTELVSSDLAETDPHRDDLDQVQQAVQRAQGLTRQLLAFSKRQVLQPVILDPNTVVNSLARMLGRLLGEDIEMTIELEPAAGLIRVDPGQLEQVLVNLAVNARDAMPTGGKLTFATRPAKGEVIMTVTDTGTGMTDAVRARVFEPFFTTKEGKGTGLGLATVHGIVSQSGGRIELTSELGRGTTFNIILPAAEGTASAGKEVRNEETPRGRETILIVEDESAVRMAAN